MSTWNKKNLYLQLQLQSIFHYSIEIQLVYTFIRKLYMQHALLLGCLSFLVFLIKKIFGKVY